MRIRYVGLAAAAWGSLAAGAWGGEDRAAPEPKPADRPITIVASASPSTLKVGARCWVRLNPVTTGRRKRVTVYDGVIARANDQGVGLTVSEVRRTIADAPTFADTLLVSPMSRTIGIARSKSGEKKEVWLASESIHSVKVIEKEADLEEEIAFSNPSFAD